MGFQSQPGIRSCDPFYYYREATEIQMALKGRCVVCNKPTRERLFRWYCGRYGLVRWPWKYQILGICSRCLGLEVKAYSRIKCPRREYKEISTTWCTNVCQYHEKGVCQYADKPHALQEEQPRSSDAGTDSGSLLPVQVQDDQGSSQ